MRPLAWIYCILLSGMVGFAAIATRADGAKTWQIDPDHTDAHFQVRHLGITNIQGDFPKVSGTLVIDDQDISKSTVEVTIDAASIYTRVPARDEDLRGADFFDVAKYPTATFHSTKLWKTGNTVKMMGDLTLHGTTKPVTFDVIGPTAPVMFMGQIHRGATATTTIRRRDFGVSGDYPTVSDDVLLTLDVDAILKK